MSIFPNLTYGCFPMWNAAQDYFIDAAQRSILFAETLHQRGNRYLKQAREDNPPVLVFDYEMLLDGRSLPRPVNYALARILPPDDYVPTDTLKQPFVVIDPRAGQGPGIGGFKLDSEIGIALKHGHPCYFFTFFPQPVMGQTIEDIAHAQVTFMKKVNQLHEKAVSKPFVIGNCQGGWALMMLASLAPELIGQIMLAGSPIAYWSGVKGKNPMRYGGGLLGGSWMASFSGDLGNGKFDGSNLVNNFESLNPSNTYWGKLYNLYANIDTEQQRFLDFERWWGGHSLMNKEEMEWITQNLFIGNKLTMGEIAFDKGKTVLDLRNIRAPIIVLASQGDNITPPQQALNWILDLYSSVDDIRLNEQTIVYCLHEKIGHLGIFVSGGVAQKEHTELISMLDLIDMLPPGLYQAIIEEYSADMPGKEFTDGNYVVTFKERNLQDIAALDDGREDEKEFEVVEHLSKVNQHLYDKFMSPLVKACSNEFTAEITRLLNPARLQRWIWSDLNPATCVFPLLAKTVDEQRKPINQDNPLLQLQEHVSKNIERSLNQYRDIRDGLYERVFKSIYGSEWLPAMLGMDKGEATHKCNSHTWVAQELHRLKNLQMEHGFEHGTQFDGYLRLFALSFLARRQIDERQYNAIRKIFDEHKLGGRRMTFAEIKESIRRQTHFAHVNPARALAGVNRLLPKEEQRRQALDMVLRLQEICGYEVDSIILEEVMQRLELSPKEETPALETTNTTSANSELQATKKMAEAKPATSSVPKTSNRATSPKQETPQKTTNQTSAETAQDTTKKENASKAISPITAKTSTRKRSES